VNFAPCQVYLEQYDAQLGEKLAQFKDLVASVALPEPQVFESPKSHFRMRAEFRLWREGDALFYVMFDSQTKARVLLDTCPLACEPIAQLMPRLLTELQADKVFSHKLFAVEFLANSLGDVLVTLIYHRPLDESWDEAGRVLQAKIGIQLIGRAKKTCRVLSENFVTERLAVGGRDYAYQQVEASFTQPNARMNEQMLAWALAQVQGARGDLLELYCGNGNFTCVLSQAFDKVLATEISKTSVASAQHNFTLNGVTNVQIARMSSEELTEALNGVREFRRLQGIDLNAYDFSTIFVDPPRSGLDEGTRVLAAGFERIVYISCNPETLARDLVTLCQTHQVRACAVFDQFPYSHHLESGVILVRKP
jgi:tRNA (uracil-5-)-methyltransferase